MGLTLANTEHRIYVCIYVFEFSPNATGVLLVGLRVAEGFSATAAAGCVCGACKIWQSGDIDFVHIS